MSTANAMSIASPSWLHSPTLWLSYAALSGSATLWLSYAATQLRCYSLPQLRCYSLLQGSATHLRTPLTSADAFACAARRPWALLDRSAPHCGQITLLNWRYSLHRWTVLLLALSAPRYPHFPLVWPLVQCCLQLISPPRVRRLRC